MELIQQLTAVELAEILTAIILVLVFLFGEALFYPFLGNQNSKLFPNGKSEGVENSL